MKKIVALCAMICFLFPLSSCRKQPNSLYKEVLRLYQYFLSHNGTLWDAPDKAIRKCASYVKFLPEDSYPFGNLIYWMSDFYAAPLLYAVYDMDGNGTPELYICALDEGNGTYYIIDIYTIQNEVVTQSEISYFDEESLVQYSFLGIFRLRKHETS